jgi:hypothetical protein
MTPMASFGLEKRRFLEAEGPILQGGIEAVRYPLDNLQA